MADQNSHKTIHKRFNFSAVKACKMIQTSDEEEIKLNIAQKPWTRSRRAFSSFSFFEQQEQKEKDHKSDEDFKELRKQLKGISINAKPLKQSKDDTLEVLVKNENTASPLRLNASNLGDFPAEYVINPLQDHQFPVMGVYIDKRVVPGFKYRVKPLQTTKYLFQGRPLTLLSIGRGYARRLTFECSNQHGDQPTYFYSDNHLEGYAFELQVLGDGDKFTIYDANGEPHGVLEILKADREQVEINLAQENGRIVRNVRVKFNANVEFYDSGITQHTLDGTAICVKDQHENFAKIIKIRNVIIKHNKYYLIPGCQEDYRRTYVKGVDIKDVPTRYTIIGLSSYEMPVIGTYIDPRILPGFHYKVRLSNRKKYLFKGLPVRLESIGKGYGKRLTFASESRINSDNFLWSDSHQDGLAFEIRVILERMKFLMVVGGQVIGEATVFRADLPQMEKCMDKVQTSPGVCSYIKHVHVDVMCHIKVDINESGVFHNENLVRVCGLAVTKKDSERRNGYVERIENIGLDSHLNLIFAHTNQELIFLPIP